jgi:protein phosphatase
VNEDAFLVADLSTRNASLDPEVRTHRLGPRGTLFMVADGLGGAAAGEIASELAVATVFEEMLHRWADSASTDPESFAASLKVATEVANTRIYAYALEHPEHRGLGTTATVAGLLGDTLYLVQVGDSRAYLVRDGVAQQLTKDQSLMQRLVEAGELTPEEAERSERRNIILQALGPEPSVKIDLTFQKLRRGDTLVLCTDGLSGLVRKEEIAEVVTREPELATVCQALVDRANENGGPDNITVVAARFEGEGLSPAESSDQIGYAVFHLHAATTPPSPPRRASGRAELVSPPAAPPPAAQPSRRAGRAGRALFLALLATILLGAVFLAARQRREGARASMVDTTVTK